MVTLIYRGIPLQQLTTTSTLRFEDPDGRNVDLTRWRLLRANHPNVRAFATSVSADSPGRIPEKSLKFTARPIKYEHQGHQENIGDEKGWEIILTFDEALPYSWYLPLVPSWFLLFAFKNGPKFLKSKVVELETKACFIDDFSRAKPSMELNGLKHYPQQEVKVHLHFHPTRMPSATAIKASLIQLNSVTMLDVIDEHLEKDQRFTIEVDRMSDERLRVTWTLPSASSPAPK